MAAAQERLTTVISTRGQVILLKAIRDLRHWPVGTRLAVENTSEGVLLKPASVFPPSSVDQVFGSLEHKGAALSVEDIGVGYRDRGETACAGLTPMWSFDS